MATQGISRLTMSADDPGKWEDAADTFIHGLFASARQPCFPSHIMLIPGQSAPDAKKTVDRRISASMSDSVLEEDVKAYDTHENPR
jgi:hypothetical protein